MRRQSVATIVQLALALLAPACRGGGGPSTEPPDLSASPQAKAEPAPIAPSTPQALGLGAQSAIGTATVTPLPMRPDEPVPTEPPAREPTRDPAQREAQKDTAAVYSLSFALRASDVPPPPKGIELAPAGVDAARRKSEPTFTVDLTPGHARATLHEGFVLPEGTELRIRSDRLGYVVVPPEGDTYRIGATGSLRAILGEGLFDVAPSSAAELAPRGEGARRLGKATRKVEVITRAARATFELARVPDVGDGGGLLCRALLDLMSARPSVPACADGEVPLRVELRWSVQPPQGPGGRGRISGVSVFEAQSIARRSDLPASVFQTPPATGSFVPRGEPVRGAHVFLAKSDLAALHAFAGETAPHTPEPASAILSLHNSTDELRYVWLDGLPLAWLGPGGRLDVAGVSHARATVQWRTFFGDAIDPAQAVTLPAMVDALGTAPGAPVSSGDSPPP